MTEIKRQLERLLFNNLLEKTNENLNVFIEKISKDYRCLCC